jgi:hypothetical protein
MSHLSLETLARLLDETPTPAEQAHLDGCDRCRTEWLGLRRQTRRLGDLPEAQPPARAWTLLEARLLDESLVTAPAEIGARARTRSSWLWTFRLAASIALFLLGGVVGATLRGPADPPMATGEDLPDVAGARAQTTATPDEAMRALRGAEASYLAALARHRELTGADRTADPMARLAALESIVLTTRAALNQAPADPVINGYHLTAVAEREAMLRRLAAATADEWF